MAPDRLPAPARLQSFTLGDWLVDPRACQLSHGDTAVKLRAQLVDLLGCLARHAGEIVLKDEILAEVWPGQYIAESGLSRCIAELRQVLQDDAQTPRYIETITKRGYRVVAPVVWVMDADDQAVEEPVEAGRPASAPTEVARPGATRRRWLGASIVVVVAAAVVLVALVLSRRPRAGLTERDDIVLCFENHTGETVFNGALQLALAVQLEQSPFLRVISDEHVRQTLELMAKRADTPFTRALAVEVCEREGARAMVVGSIARLGSRYVLGLEAVACRSGETLARQQIEVNGKEAVLGGLGDIAKRLRQALGESLASVERHAVPIARATTASLEALRAASLGDLEWRRGRAEEAVFLYRQAIAFDPSFALAYARLGPPLWFLKREGQYQEALTRAYELRDRTSLPERFEIEASYYQGALDDNGKTIDAFERLRRTYPRSAVARRGLVQAYALVGRYEEALVEALEAVRLEPDSGLDYGALARAYLHLNRLGEVKNTARAAMARKIDDPGVHSVLFDCALIAGDGTAMEREVAWAASQSDAQMLLVELQSRRAIHAGRLREATSTLERMEAMSRARGDELQAATTRLDAAFWEATHGGRAAALALTREVLSKPAADRIKMRAAIGLAFAGADGQVAALVAEAEDKANMQGDSWRNLRLILLAIVETDREHPDRAIQLLEPLAPVELGADYALLPVIARGQAYLRAGNGAAAVAEFDKILVHSGVEGYAEIAANARLGLARGYALAANPGASRRAYDALFAQWRDADADLPLLATARREYAALPK